jgi:hypothetical protein
MPTRSDGTGRMIIKSDVFTANLDTDGLTHNGAVTPRYNSIVRYSMPSALMQILR